MPKLDLFRLPKDAPREALADATVIVVDLLRASTTICTALAAGAECVMPFAEIDETLAAAARFGRDQVVLGGERGGKLIPGFDLGNSPAEYTPQRVAGHRILFTTTNGARALHHARDARCVLVGAAVNRAALALAVSREQDAVVLCAGTDGVPAREDMLAGGAIIEAFCYVADNVWELGDEASDAYANWQVVRGELGPAAPELVARFAAELRDTDGGRNLIDIGQDADLPTCAQLDVLTVVPQLNPATNELRPA
jgi:2-phosphosulfolactate phosphatase